MAQRKWIIISRNKPGYLGLDAYWACYGSWSHVLDSGCLYDDPDYPKQRAADLPSPGQGHLPPEVVPVDVEIRIVVTEVH